MFACEGNAVGVGAQCVSGLHKGGGNCCNLQEQPGEMSIKCAILCNHPRSVSCRLIFFMVSVLVI